MITVEGKAGITATIVAHSKSAVNGKEILTYELVYPRFIHAEFLVHRMFSRNSASSRAIPVKRMIELVKEQSATFVHWGKNQAGMQAKEELADYEKKIAGHWWLQARYEVVKYAGLIDSLGTHKQIVNRLLEPFQMMKVVCTATEWDNFFWLRNHADAQPEIAELAKVMLEAKKQSVPEVLQPGEWHTPYVEHERTEDGLRYITYQDDGYGFYTSLENALKISCSCCAQVSYRRLDDTLEKALDIYKRLVESEPVHASALEHCATPMVVADTTTGEDTLSVLHRQGGTTHVSKDGSYWSGNFQSWVQYRQLIPGHVCNNYKE